MSKPYTFSGAKEKPKADKNMLSLAKEINRLESALAAEQEARKKAEENAAELARLLNEEIGGVTHLGEPVIAPQPDAQLCKFYAVSNYPDLVKAMENHISRLQTKLPPIRDTQPGRVREG